MKQQLGLPGTGLENPIARDHADNSPSCSTKDSSPRDGQPGLAHKISDSPNATEPRELIERYHVTPRSDFEF
jgi:hypothetical protein